MADAVYRQWLLLRRIPRAPRRYSTRELWQRLRAEGEEVSKRTVERDLIALSASFAFTCESEGTTTYWFWPADAAALDVPGLDPAGALALVLAHEHLEPLLPASTLETLAPYLRRAQQVLDAESGRRLGSWRNKVRTVTRGPKLLKPRIAPAIHAAITDALLRERRLRARYRGRQTESIKDYTLNPLGLVAKEGVLYLIATAWNFDTPFQYALHRFFPPPKYWTNPRQGQPSSRWIATSARMPRSVIQKAQARLCWWSILMPIQLCICANDRCHRINRLPNGPTAVYALPQKSPTRGNCVGGCLALPKR